MNKEEVINKINEMTVETFFSKTLFVQQKKGIELIEQLDEPEKEKIPQFVADWLSNLKSGLFGLNYDSVPSEIYDWVYAAEDNLRKLHLAFVYGYEVGEEKRYLVTLKNGQPLVKSQLGNTLYFNQNITAGNYKVTRKELEAADFGWVFDCPGMEIEEVDE